MSRIALTKTWGVVSTALAALVVAPRVSLACPACFAATGGHGLTAYYLSTVLLSTMPFLLIGVIIAIAYSAKRSRPGPDRGS